MNGKRGWTLLALALCGAVAAGAALAQEEGAGRGQRRQRAAEGAGRQMKQEGERGGPGRGLLHDLNLTEEQREQIKAIHEKYQPQLEAARKTVREAVKALRDAVRANPVNEGAIRAAATQVGNAVGDLAIIRANQHAEIRAVLTAEQQAKFDAAIEEMPPAGGPRGGGMGGGPRGGPQDELDGLDAF
jgi:Spy/CpxP family protein refolding chaperone